MTTEIPISILINDSEIRFRDIHKNFSQTTYGKKLNESIRWSRFIPKSMEKSDWQKLLGYDINNLEHLRLTYETTKLFIKHVNQSDCGIFFEPEEQRKLILTGLTHDYGEAIGGDIAFDLKTRANEAKEMNHLFKIFTELFKDGGKDLAESTKSILTDKNSKLGMAFNAIETIGYVRTGLKAWKKGETTTNETLSLKHLKCLSGNCFGNNISRLIKYSEIYPPVETFLDRKKDTINQVFNTISPICFNQYPSEKERLINIEKFEKARLDWTHYQETKLL